MKEAEGGACPRPAGRPRCAGTDEAILDATLRQLAAEGYSRMSVEAIAAAAGTTKPTIYRRWASKADLAVAALARYQAHEQPQPTGVTADDLRAALRDFHRKLLRPNGMAMIGTLLAEERHTPELIARFRERIVRPRRRLLQTILEGARGRGELRPGADLEAAVTMLVGSFYARYLTGEGVPADWPERVVATVLSGIAK
jgi:AcrR family transcriptional regulator